MKMVSIVGLFTLFGLHSAVADESGASVVLAKAANVFLASLDVEQRSKAQLEFTDDTRLDWHYFPKDRKGLPWKEMNEKQRELSWAFLKEALSSAGFEKVRGVVAAERVLWEKSGHSDNRDPDRYHITFFGKPSENKNWGVSLEGHHLSVNLTIVKGTGVYVTPSFFGSNPDTLDGGPEKGLRPLRSEYEQAHQLLQMLNQEQLSQAVVANKAIREIATRAEQRVSAMKPEGLSASDMDPAQVKQVMRLINEYTGRYRAEFAKDDLAKLETAGIGNIYFAWAGGTEVGEPVYYRIQGPTFVMEYANTQGGANHSHTVWRDFKNDFGYDALKVHLEQHH